jgi:hypothetical protein
VDVRTRRRRGPRCRVFDATRGGGAGVETSARRSVRCAPWTRPLITTGGHDNIPFLAAKELHSSRGMVLGPGRSVLRASRELVPVSAGDNRGRLSIPAVLTGTVLTRAAPVQTTTYRHMYSTVEPWQPGLVNPSSPARKASGDLASISRCFVSSSVRRLAMPAHVPGPKQHSVARDTL